MKQLESVFLDKFKEMFERLIFCIAAAAVGVSAGGSEGCSALAATVAALAVEYSTDELNVTCSERFHAFFDAAVIAEYSYDEYYNAFGPVFDDCLTEMSVITEGFEAKVESLVGVTSRGDILDATEDAPYPISCVVQKFYDYYINYQVLIITFRSLGNELLTEFEKFSPKPSSSFEY